MLLIHSSFFTRELDKLMLALLLAFVLIHDHLRAIQLYAIWRRTTCLCLDCMPFYRDWIGRHTYGNRVELWLK